MAKDYSDWGRFIGFAMDHGKTAEEAFAARDRLRDLVEEYHFRDNEARFGISKYTHEEELERYDDKFLEFWYDEFGPDAWDDILDEYTED